jgi:transposase
VVGGQYDRLVISESSDDVTSTAFGLNILKQGNLRGQTLRARLCAGHLNRVRSSRQLEMESHRNVEVVWLLRSLKPDFKTIADFRRDNRAAFRSVFRQFALFCRRLDLYGGELLAVDESRINAVNNKDGNFTGNSLQNFVRAADERLDD